MCTWCWGAAWAGTLHHFRNRRWHHCASGDCPEARGGGGKTDPGSDLCVHKHAHVACAHVCMCVCMGGCGCGWAGGRVCEGGWEGMVAAITLLLGNLETTCLPCQLPWKAQMCFAMRSVSVMQGIPCPLAKFKGRPHHWVTPFLGKRGQICLSRHNFASSAPFPDLSTPLDSLYFSGSDGGLGVEIGAVSGRQFRENGM